MTTAEVEGLLRKLAERARTSQPDSGDALDGLVGDMAGHTDRLRATMTAQHEANELLAVAQRVRGAAAEQAEQILSEARQSAERLLEETREATERVRREASQQVSQQQEQVETLVRELRESATRDAERIRAEALGTAMAEAEGTAHRYAARAMAQGERDAEGIRDEARDLLHQSSSLMALASTSLQELSGTLGRFVDDLQTQTGAMERLRDDAEIRVAQQAAARAQTPVPAVEPEPTPVFDRLEKSSAADREATPETASRPLGSLFRSNTLTDGVDSLSKDH